MVCFVSIYNINDLTIFYIIYGLHKYFCVEDVMCFGMFYEYQLRYGIVCYYGNMMLNKNFERFVKGMSYERLICKSFMIGLKVHLL